MTRNIWLWRPEPVIYSPMIKRLTLITLMVTGFAFLSQASWSLAWHVEGTAFGDCQIGLGVGTGAPAYFAAQSPPGVFTRQYRIPSDGTNLQTSGGNCVEEFPANVWTIWKRPYSGGTWVKDKSFSYNDVSPNCCSNEPPQSCTGTYVHNITCP